MHSLQIKSSIAKTYLNIGLGVRPRSVISASNGQEAVNSSQTEKLSQTGRKEVDIHRILRLQSGIGVQGRIQVSCKKKVQESTV